MLQNYNKWKVLQPFFDAPLAEGGLQLREISRKVKLAPPSVKNYLHDLQKENLILERKHRLQSHPVYVAHRDDVNFKFYKKIDLIFRLKQSGLLQDIQNKCLPSAIIIFGSAARGEDTEYSDIDLFVGAKELTINVDKYEKVVHRRISLFFEEDFKKLSKELKNNILNGILLYGYVKVF
ncbi:MAG: nucleotidyltransferase domain-containing protein [Nanoarchaeota archaeon]